MSRRDDKDLFRITPDGLPEHRAGASSEASGVADQGSQHYTPLYYRKSVVAVAAAVIVLGPIAGISIYSVAKNGNEAGIAAESPNTRKAPAGWAEKMAKAEVARKALAERYESCEITAITDTQTSQEMNLKVLDQRGFPQPTQRTPRNEVHMTISATKTAAAMQAERDYADGTPDAEIVQWYPFSQGTSTSIIKKDANGNPIRVYIPRTSQAKTSGASGETETFSVTMFPRTDNRRTTRANVSIYTHLETYNPYEGKDGTVYEAMGRITCGDIHEVTVDGRPKWHLDPNPANPIPPIETNFRACAFGATDEMGISTKECK